MEYAVYGFIVGMVVGALALDGLVRLVMRAGRRDREGEPRPRPRVTMVRGGARWYPDRRQYWN